MGLFGESARESLVEQSPAAALRFAVAAGVAAIAAWLHWRRFRVPITVAAGTIAAVGTGFALLLSVVPGAADWLRSEEHTSELQSLMRISYAVFCLKKKNI